MPTSPAPEAPANATRSLRLLAFAAIAIGGVAVCRGLLQSRAAAPTPLDPLQQVVEMDPRGETVIRFRFRNDTGAPLGKPATKTTCSCHDPEWKPAVVAPGEVGTFTARAIRPKNQGSEAAAILTWQNGAVSRLRWSVVRKKIHGLQCSPAVLTRFQVKRRGLPAIAFAAHYLRDTPPGEIEMTAQIGERRFPVRISELRWPERTTAVGVAAIETPAEWQLTGAESATQLVLHCAGFDPTPIPIR